jgi:hypothetical protein
MPDGVQQMSARRPQTGSWPVGSIDERSFSAGGDSITLASQEATTPPVADAAQSLSEKLASLELNGAEAAALDAIVRRAHEALRPDVEPVVDTGLIPATVQRAVIARTARSLRIGIDEARCALEDAVTFLRAAAEAPSFGLSPSPKVDAAWHQFVLFTVDYGRFCDSLGTFVHHVPLVDEQRPPFEGWRKLSLADTYAFIRAEGHPLHDELWRSPTVADAIAYLQRA